MEPEEVDKLFNERLGRMAPAPPVDLWNRLQERMETELPQPEKHEEKRRFGWLYYSIAAAVTLLLAVGIVLRYMQPQTTITSGTIAQAEAGKGTVEPLQTITPEVENSEKQGIATVTTPEKVAAPVTVKPAIVDNAQKAVAKKVKTQPRHNTEERWVKVEAPEMLAQQQPKAAPANGTTSEAAAMQTPASFASAGSAEPVQIIIKRAVAQDNIAVASAAEPEETSAFERKQKLAKSIFKQVKNLSNGEPVSLSELGVNADRIALETRIGKQKVSKVINL